MSKARHGGAWRSRGPGLAPVHSGRKKVWHLSTARRRAAALGLEALFRASVSLPRRLRRASSGRCPQGLGQAVRCAHFRTSGAARPNPGCRCNPGAARGQRNPHQPCSVQPCPGPLQFSLPAAGDGSRFRPLQNAARTLTIEASAVTDNPIVFADEDMPSPAAISMHSRSLSPQTQSPLRFARSARFRNGESAFSSTPR